MRSRWTQPSLSRDFTLLSAVILFILCIISMGVTYSTYTSHEDDISEQMQRESLRIEEAIKSELENAHYVLKSLGKQIILDNNHTALHLAEFMKSFDSSEYVYSIISWVNPKKMLIVSSNKGVLESPVDLSDRDYVQHTEDNPWKMQIGKPIQGRVSSQWVIPVSMGLTDYTGKFIGTITISLNINILNQRLNRIIQREGLSFAILDASLTPVTQISDTPDFLKKDDTLSTLEKINVNKVPQGTISRGNPFFSDHNHAFYRTLKNHPYVILLVFDPEHSDLALRRLLWSRLLQIAAMAVFFVCFLWIARTRMIAPVLDLTHTTREMVRGDATRAKLQNGPIEIERLSTQINKLGDYIDENRRIQDELRSKIAMLRQSRDHAQAQRRSQTEFLAYVCQEMRTPLNNIIGGAQVMKDQLYGPIENRKYRQYANDIFTTGNGLMDRTQHLLTVAKTDTGYIDLNEKNVDISTTINKALRFASDKMQTDKLGIKVHLQEALPKLYADEFRLQQIIMNLLLYVLGQTPPDNILTLEAKIVTESRENMTFALIISNHDNVPYTDNILVSMIKSPSELTIDDDVNQHEPHEDITLSLVKSLTKLHGAQYHAQTSENGKIAIALFFPSNRIRTIDSNE